MKLHRHLGMAVLAIFLALSPAAVSAGPALVVELETGLVLYAEDPDVAWHPASLTKLMTAYLAFEAIRDGKVSLEDKVVCSQHAFEQPPSKVGLPLGGEMSMDMALKALIVKSANDVAVMLAEKIAGSEEAFVAQMNATVQRLGMKNTQFYNANGLPNPLQVTTARDLAVLARVLWREFPQYAYLYSTPMFKLGKRFLRTHNSLLNTFDGANGMKTGFVCAAGYNIVASAKRGDRQIIAIVLGERSGAARANRAASLMEHGFDRYMWKAMFPTTLDQMERDKSAETLAPADLQDIVCTHRRIHTKKQPRKLVKAKQPGAKAAKTAKAPKKEAGAQ